MRLLAHRSFMLQMSVSCWPPFFTLSALPHGRVNLWFIYMYISCKGTQNLRYPNAVKKYFSLHGIGLRLMSKENMPSRITKSFTLLTKQLFPNRPTQGWTVKGLIAPLGHLCQLGHKIVIPTAMHMPWPCLQLYIKGIHSIYHTLHLLVGEHGRNGE